MNKMKAVLGIFLIVLGVVVGLYCGVWWAFIDGIVGVISEIQAEEIWVLALMLIVPGFLMLNSKGPLR